MLNGVVCFSEGLFGWSYLCAVGWYCVGIVALIGVFSWLALLLFVYGSSLIGLLRC